MDSEIYQQTSGSQNNPQGRNPILLDLLDFAFTLIHKIPPGTELVING